MPNRVQNISEQVLRTPTINSPGGLVAAGQAMRNIARSDAVGMGAGATILGGGAFALSQTDPNDLGRQMAQIDQPFYELMGQVQEKASDLAQIPQAYFMQVRQAYDDERQKQQEMQNIQEFGTFEEPEFIPESGEIKPVSLFMKDGDEVKKNNGFPDLSGDGKITRKDILIGQGVEFAEGGEAIDDDLESMQMSEEDAMNQMNQLTQSPEVQMIEQLIGVVQQLIAQGVSEEEIKMFLKEQGLDDEDIESLFEMIAESGMQQEQGANIDQQLQSIM